MKICCYRLAQEGLNNGWRHAMGKGQELRLTVQGDALRVLDRGPGFAHLPVDFASEDSGLGLAGLTDRVESLGGHLEVLNRTDGPGADLRRELDLKGAA